jgi:hypothetical protein
MPKKVVNLVRDLKAKSVQQIVEWLRAIGYDVNQEGFGAMSEVDDATIEKMRRFATGKVKPVGPPGRIKRGTAVGGESEPGQAPPKTKQIIKSMADVIAEPEALVKAIEAPVAVVPEVPVPIVPRPLKQIVLDQPDKKKVKLKKEKPKGEDGKQLPELEEVVPAEIEAVEVEEAATDKKQKG